MQTLFVFKPSAIDKEVFGEDNTALRQYSQSASQNGFGCHVLYWQSVLPLLS